MRSALDAQDLSVRTKAKYGWEFDPLDALHLARIGLVDPDADELALHATTEEPEEGEAQVHYYAQGDPVYYRQDVVRLRVQLMKDEEIAEATATWFDFLEKVPGSDPPAVSKEGYVRMNVKIQRTLLPLEGWSDAQALADAEEDWSGDATTSGSINRRDFHTALFQLADLWVDSVTPADYVKCA